MNQKIKINVLTIFFILLPLLANCLFAQNAELITQKINVENAIRDKVGVTINKLVDRTQYVIIVNARMDRKPSFQFSETKKETNEDKEEIKTPYSPIPGLLPTVPQQTIHTPTQNKGSFDYSTDKYLLYGLDIAIYLDEQITNGALKQNINRLVLDAIPEIVDCEDCIRFETMKMNGPENNNYQEMLDKIAKLEEDRRAAEQQIINWRFDQLEQQLVIAEDARQEWESQARQREQSRHLADSTRMSNLQKIENEYRKKQDSLYLTTSLKLDEAIRGRIETQTDVNNKLIDIIKAGMTPTADQDVMTGGTPKEGPIDVQRESGTGNNLVMWIIISIIVLLLLSLLVLAIKNQKQTPIYLKPKATTNGNQENSSTAPLPAQQSTASDNNDVLRSELNSLRQSAVSMSVGQKEGATQIVKDWIDEGEDKAEETTDEENQE